MKMRLTYGEVFDLVNAGMLNVSARTLSARDRYNVFDLKQKLKEAFKRREEREKEIIGECGIEDAAAFDARNEELRGKVKNGSITEEERKELDGNHAKLETYLAQRSELNRDSVKMEVRPIGYEAWFALRDENARARVLVNIKDNDGKEVQKEEERDLIPDFVESVLFGKFWTAPEEDRPAEEKPETAEEV